MAIYGEAGMIGVVGAMFVYLVVSMSKKSEAQQQTLEDLKIENRGQSETLENIEGMVIKLIERWNKSDEISLRHREDIVREIGDLSEKISYISGRINGKTIDSLRTSAISTSLGLVYYTDLISGILMCIMFSVNIYYLLCKTKKIKEK